MRSLGGLALVMALVGLVANCGSDDKTSGSRARIDAGLAGNSGSSRTGSDSGLAGNSGTSTSGRTDTGGKGGGSGKPKGSGGCTQIWHVDYPCFHDSLSKPKCSPSSTGIRVVGQEVSCQEATGNSCCSGGGCRPREERCEEGEACAYPDAPSPFAKDNEAKCVPESRLCGGAKNKACPEGQYCERHGLFYAPSLQTSTLCEYVNGGGMGVCQPLPSESECAADSRPVCGCDGVTYANQCARKRASAAYARSGECHPDGSVENQRDAGDGD